MRSGLESGPIAKRVALSNLIDSSFRVVAGLCCVLCIRIALSLTFVKHKIETRVEKDFPCRIQQIITNKMSARRSKNAILC